MAKKKPEIDVEHLREIGARGGNKTKRRKGKAYYSRIAKLSHPKNNPNAKRGKYVGGRPEKESSGTVA